MSSPLSNQVEQALAEFERQKAAISDIQGNLTGALTTVTAKNRAVAVTVNSQGAVTTIKFPTAAYRSMAGPELGDLLVSTIEAARVEALSKTVAAFESFLPSGMPMMDVLTGKVGAGDDSMPLDRLLAEVLRTTEQADPGAVGDPGDRPEASR